MLERFLVRQFYYYGHLYSVPSLIVDVQHDGGAPIYAGSMLTLTCYIFVVSIPSNLHDGVTVTTAWLGAAGNMLTTGNRITVNPAEGSGLSVYSSLAGVGPSIISANSV